MALDPSHFSLSNALKKIWEKKNFLTDEQKKLIERALNRGGAPENEDELDVLHTAVTSCRALSKIGTGDVHWLSEEGKKFPTDTAVYIHKVATLLHNYDGSLPKDFEDSIIDFIKKTKSHVATLNYDKLLYSSFIENNIVSGYSGFLVDGMLHSGFSSDNLERKRGRNFGYYLHLHGSPLFKDLEDKKTVKLSRGQLDVELNIPSNHIVLTHVKHKPTVITGSYVLSSYWEYLSFSLSEVNEIVLFGYSGCDTHLNEMLRPYLQAKCLSIIEWEGAGNEDERKRFWKETLKKAPDRLIRLDNITNFREW